jgi:hypothetical protein
VHRTLVFSPSGVFCAFCVFLLLRHGNNTAVVGPEVEEVTIVGRALATPFSAGFLLLLLFFF